MNVAVTTDLPEETALRPIHPVLLSGGAGTRLWPLSRALCPKQLLPLLSERTMLQETALRTGGDGTCAAPLVVCNEEHRFLISEQLSQIGVVPQRIILEPVGRNTAPALAVAALLLAESEPGALMLVQPADHRIGDLVAFRRAVALAARVAASGRLVTFGITPSEPETGYGYIAPGASLAGHEGAFAVDRFLEKPDSAAARELITQGCLWNSGLFLLPVGRYLAELERFEPVMLEACRQALADGKADLEFFRLDAAAFGRAPSLPVDRAVMERTAAAAVIPVDMAWSDIGSWRRLHEAREPDAQGNVLDGDVLAEDLRHCYVRAQDRLVAAVGLENVIIVSTDDATLVAAADRSEEVSRVVERLRQAERPERLHHTRVYRPWGFYQTVDQGDRFQVKRIMVKPGASLSLQMHHHRAEHWVVVAGTARVTRDDETLLLRENESIYIPLGARHRLENPGKLPLHLIEVQSGAYLGEDDIVRFDDRYGRS
jgi:mannose-1-phosphate guanylyltransferase/mannose-6-phosphate isomerase